MDSSWKPSGEPIATNWSVNCAALLMVCQKASGGEPRGLPGILAAVAGLRTVVRKLNYENLCFARPCCASLCYAARCDTSLRPATSVIPNQLTPVGRNDAVAKSTCDHAPMPHVGAKDMATPTESPKIAHAIRAEFAGAYVVYMAAIERYGPTAMDALMPVALPHLAARIGPYLSWLSCLGHVFALLN